MRNPAEATRDLVRRWWILRPLTKVILNFRDCHPACQNLTDCVGTNPDRQPPGQGVLLELRAQIGRQLGLSRSQSDEHHPASPWRFNLFHEVLARTDDMDAYVSSWLERGAPFGINVPIPPGGWFPPSEAQDDVDFIDYAPVLHNHPSFLETQGVAEPPGRAWIQEQLEAGRVRLFEDKLSAEKWLGQQAWPSPLGNVKKLKADGTVKHRPVQDQRRSGVNQLVVLPERQILPRPLDHARDLALLASQLQPGQAV